MSLAVAVDLEVWHELQIPIFERQRRRWFGNEDGQDVCLYRHEYMCVYVVDVSRKVNQVATYA